MCQVQDIGKFLCQEKQRDKYILLFDFENYKIIKRRLHRGEVLNGFHFIVICTILVNLLLMQDRLGLAVQTA